MHACAIYVTYRKKDDDDDAKQHLLEKTNLRHDIFYVHSALVMNQNINYGFPLRYQISYHE